MQEPFILYGGRRWGKILPKLRKRGTRKIKYMRKKKKGVGRGKNGGARKNSGRKKITEDREQTRSITKGISLTKEQWEALDTMRGDTARGDFLFSSTMKLGHYNI